MEYSLFPETGICYRESGFRLSYLVLTIFVTAISHETEKDPLSPLVISCNCNLPPPRFPSQRDLRALYHSIVRFTFLFLHLLRMPGLNQICSLLTNRVCSCLRMSSGYQRDDASISNAKTPRSIHSQLIVYHTS
jgi:hypothetical protein